MTPPAIDVAGLGKRFGAVRALQDVSFTVGTGTIFGLLGPNGAGKTTAIRILTTLLRPDAGHARVLGYDVVRDAARVRRVIGLAGQAAAVDVNLTGRENLRLMGRLNQLPRSVFTERAEALLELFGLSGAASRPVRGYSGGMRRRLDIAVALVAAAPVLFLDEPTTGLDPQSRNDLWSTIRDLAADGTTVVLTTQYLEEADHLAERVAVVHRGRVVADESPAVMKARVGTVVDVTLHDDADAARAAGVLARLDGVAVERERSTVRLRTRDGAGLLVGALRALDDAALTATGVQVREPSLDEAFLQLTGRHAQET